MVDVDREVVVDGMGKVILRSVSAAARVTRPPRASSRLERPDIRPDGAGRHAREPRSFNAPTYPLEGREFEISEGGSGLSSKRRTWSPWWRCPPISVEL